MPTASKTVYRRVGPERRHAQGERRVMDCIDCHNRAAHTIVDCRRGDQPRHGRRRHQPRSALGSQRRPGVAEGRLRQPGRSAATKIPEQLEAFYRTQHPEVLASKAALVKAAGEELVTLFNQNVFPVHEGHLGNASQPHRAHELSGLLPLPRRRPRRQETAPASRRTAPPATTCWPWKKPSRRCSPTSGFSNRSPCFFAGGSGLGSPALRHSFSGQAGLSDHGNAIVPRHVPYPKRVRVNDACIAEDKS